MDACETWEWMISIHVLEFNSCQIPLILTCLGALLGDLTNLLLSNQLQLSSSEWGEMQKINFWILCYSIIMSFHAWSIEVQELS